MISKAIVNKNAWQKIKSLLGNPAWQGIGAILALLALLLTYFIWRIDKNSQVAEIPISTTASPLVSISTTEETPIFTEQPVVETPVVPTITPISPTQEEIPEGTPEETPTTSVPIESVSIPCLRDQWLPYPNSFSTLVPVDNDGCKDFKELRFTLYGRTLEMYAKTPSDTNIMGIYTTIPDGEWHKTFEIQVVKFEEYADGRINRFFIGFIDPLDSKFKGKLLEIYSREKEYALGRLFAGEALEQYIEIGSIIVMDCKISDLHETTCSITIDEGPERIFEDVLPDDQSINAFFIGYSIFKDSTMKITVTDKSEETIFR